MPSALISSAINDTELSFLNSTASATPTGQIQATVTGFKYTANAIYGFFRLMQGTVPDASTLTWTSRTSDTIFSIPLVSMVSYTAGTNKLKLDNNNALVYPSISGTATWFWICGYYSQSFQHYSTEQMVGTVSTSGGGGDLILQTTSFNTSTGYTFREMNIALPTSYTY